MKIFPDTIIDYSYEQIIYEHNKPSNLLYTMIIVIVIGVFISFFFIHMDVGANALGMVQYRGKVAIVIAPADGILNILNIAENTKVAQGDTIYMVNDEKNNKYPIVSPIDGICINTSKLTEGLKVSLGQQLMEIVPDCEFCIECDVSSKDIGLLKTGLPCNIQVDSYNYNQWGMLNGTLVEISENPTASYRGTFYKVYCSIDKDFLELKNGYKGYLKRGMNVNCRFVVNQRRIIDLLYDKIENWINPLY